MSIKSIDLIEPTLLLNVHVRSHRRKIYWEAIKVRSNFCTEWGKVWPFEVWESGDWKMKNSWLFVPKVGLCPGANLRRLSHFASKPIEGSDLQHCSGKHEVRIFHVRYTPEASSDRIVNKFGLEIHFMDIIICAKFYFNPFRGFDFVGVEFCLGITINYSTRANILQKLRLKKLRQHLQNQQQKHLQQVDNGHYSLNNRNCW